MYKLLSYVTLILLYCGLVFGFVDLNQLTDKQMLIFQQTINVYGKLTKDMHQDFWSDVADKDKAAKDYAENKHIDTEMSRIGSEYQLELWKSALISYQNQEVFKSNKYQEIKDEMNDIFIRGSKSISDIDERNRTLERMKISIINSENLLISAAARENMQSVQGPIVDLSEQNIKFVISNIEESFVRVERLLNPNWAY